METDWLRLAPLLREGWTGPPEAWACLTAHRAIIERGVRAAMFTRRRLPGGAEAQELLQEVLCVLMERARKGRGLSVQDGRNAGGWLLVVARNCATDCLRRQAVRERYEVLPDLDRGPTEVGASSVVAPDEEQQSIHRRLDQGSAFRAGLERLQQLPPLHALAWILLQAPELLTRDHLERAASTVGRTAAGLSTGLSRSVAESWPLLLAWRDQHGDAPGTSAARRHLAWILRGEGDAPEPWLAADRERAHRAVSLLQKWDARARAALRSGGEL